ncbi:hypothetical protein [Vibrio owensii]|uniref:hypothetical protein n=1 Tax=Vibrio owensii TaxID=696485 RepID=UPI0019D182D6|nr:hypothetical protein [Vibrio owensii]
MNKRLGLTLLTCTLLSSPSFGGEIAVLNAVIKDKAIEGAQVTWQRNGESSQSDTTSSEGKAAIPSSLVDDSDTTMLISKPGYSTLVVKCPCDNFTYALSPVMQNLNGLRVVLTWGKNPLDLDSHLIYPNDHVYYADKMERYKFRC